MKFQHAAFALPLAWSSPFVRWQGSLADVSSLDLAAAVTGDALADRRFDRTAIDRVVLGMTIPQPHGFYGAPWLASRLGLAEVSGPLVAQACATSVACIVATLLLYPVVAIVCRIPMRRFARAAFEPQLIAFSSSSSIATLPALVESAEKRLALPEEVTGFVLPLAVSTFKIAAPVSWTVGALFVGWFYGVPLHLGGLATIAFAAVFLAFAVPGIPRGAFIMLTPLFLTLGLPAEGIGILIAVDAIPDLFATVLNSTGDLAAATLVARNKIVTRNKIVGDE